MPQCGVMKLGVRRQRARRRGSGKDSVLIGRAHLPGRFSFLAVFVARYVVVRLSCCFCFFVFFSTLPVVDVGTWCMLEVPGG